MQASVCAFRAGGFLHCGAQAEVEEREAAAAAKELETVRLRAMQQKATDHKSELDELRARRRADPEGGPIDGCSNLC